MNSSSISPYTVQLKEQLNTITPHAYDRLESIADFPFPMGCKILAVLVELACQSQNIGKITVSRQTLKRIPENWLSKHLTQVIQSSITLENEWEYRRLLELLREVAPHLLVNYIEEGLASNNEEVREAANDFLKFSNKEDTHRE